MQQQQQPQPQGNVPEIQTVQTIRGVVRIGAAANLAGIFLTVNHRRPQTDQGNAKIMKIAKENQSVGGIHACVNMVAHTQIVGGKKPQQKPQPVALCIILVLGEILIMGTSPIDLNEYISIICPYS